MSFNEGDPATRKQAKTVQLRRSTASANIRTCFVRLIPLSNTDNNIDWGQHISEIACKAT